MSKLALYHYIFHCHDNCHTIKSVHKHVLSLSSCTFYSLTRNVYSLTWSLRHSVSMMTDRLIRGLLAIDIVAM